MSRIGKKAVAVPKDVKIEIKDRLLCVSGAKGSLSRTLAAGITVEIEPGQAFIKRGGDTKLDKSLHGLYRALLVNMIKGVTEGYVKELEIIGVGFKAQVQAKELKMNVGFSHPVIFPVPEGITIETPKLTSVIVKGLDKELVGKVACEIRRVCPPEPYKGKGIRYLGEQVKKKVGKAQGTK